MFRLTKDVQHPRALTTMAPNKLMTRPTLLCALSLSILAPAMPAAEVFEAALGREAELPGGKEADGIRGDFILRSDKVEAVISANLPNRRANMSTFYGEDGISPGLLYDLTLRGANNDQLVAYGPLGHGPVSYVRALEPGVNAGAAVESVTTAAMGGGVFKRIEYRVEDGIQGVFVTATLRNESNQAQKVSVKPDLVRFESTGTTGDGIFWMDAVNPAHKCGYAVGVLELAGIEKLGDTLELAPAQEVSASVFFAVGTSPAAAVGEFRAVKGGQTGLVSGQITGSNGKGIASATLLVPDGKGAIPAYPDAEGHYSLRLPLGQARITVTDLGRPEALIQFPVTEGTVTAPKVVMQEAAGIRFAITDEHGKPMPCKAHFLPLDEGAPKLNLGPRSRAHGCVDQYHSENGHFIQQLPPGNYRVVVVRGPEFNHLEKELKVEPNKLTDFTGSLKRLVDTTGWISADFHNHSTPSGDNVCDTDGRLINLAAEHIEFAPTTEHNRLYDWEPFIRELGLAPFLKTVKGIELTGRGQHFNAFPFEPNPLLQDGGAPVWNDDPRITALTLRKWQGENPARWIQFNHPDLAQNFNDRNADGIPDGGFFGVGMMIDGTETQNFSDSAILHDAPFIITRAPGALAAKATPVREFLWRQLLNQGHRLVAVAVADAHTVYGNGVGGWRIYLPSSTDEPEKIDWQELSPHAKAGHIILSSGPFLEVTTPDGKTAGDDTRATGGIDLKVRVQCTDWLDIDRVQVLVNSRAVPELLFTRDSHPGMFQDGVVKFDHTLHIPLQEDAHLIVVADHRTLTLAKGFGTSDQSKLRPCAYNNPIYVDIDGNGFQPNGDTLGYPIPGSGLSADQAKAFLDHAASRK